MIKNKIRRTWLLAFVTCFTIPMNVAFSKDKADILAPAMSLDVKSKSGFPEKPTEDDSINKAAYPTKKKDVAKSKPATGSSASDNANYVFVIDQDLSQLLKEFGRSSGLVVEVDPEIRAHVRNQKIPLEQHKFIEFVTSHYEVTVAQEDRALRFSPLTPPVSRMFMLNKVTLDRLIKAAMAAGLDIKKYSMRVIPESNSIVLDAPTSVLGRVAALIDSLAVSPASNITIIRFGRIDDTNNTQNTNLSK